MHHSISADELATRANDPELCIVDVRPVAAYRGWRLHGERRGGHIPGAVDFPLDWLDAVPTSDLSARLAAKDISPDRTVVAYGFDESDSAHMAYTLAGLGYPDVRVLHGGFGAWVADAQRPTERLARHEKLVYPGWIRAVLRGEPIEAGPPGPLVLLDCGADERGQYAQGHIPGAVYFDTSLVEREPSWNCVPPDELARALPPHGITADATVVCYGRSSIAAARVAVILMYAGVEDVRLLDGGFQAWQRAGFVTETESRSPVPAPEFGAPIPRRPEYLEGTTSAKALLAAPDGVLVSVRSWGEYVGETSGYEWVGPTGRIAGAAWGHAGKDKDSLEDYHNPDGTLRNAREIAANWAKWGITPHKRVVFYCGTGWRASEAFFYAYAMGWPRIAVYDGGWHEWSSDPANPVEVGEPRGRSRRLRVKGQIP